MSLGAVPLAPCPSRSATDGKCYCCRCDCRWCGIIDRSADGRTSSSREVKLPRWIEFYVDPT